MMDVSFVRLRMDTIVMELQVNVNYFVGMALELE
jgi:hypothetical protein